MNSYTVHKNDVIRFRKRLYRVVEHFSRTSQAMIARVEEQDGPFRYRLVGASMTVECSVLEKEAAFVDVYDTPSFAL